MKPERVRVDVVRRGGFAGITRTASADTDDLDDEAGAVLRRLLDDSGLDGQSEPDGARRPAGADRFEYDVTIARNDREYRLTRRESDLSPAEQRLIRWVLGNR